MRPKQISSLWVLRWKLSLYLERLRWTLDKKTKGTKFSQYLFLHKFDKDEIETPFYLGTYYDKELIMTARKCISCGVYGYRKIRLRSNPNYICVLDNNSN